MRHWYSRLEQRKFQYFGRGFLTQRRSGATKFLLSLRRCAAA